MKGGDNNKRILGRTIDFPYPRPADALAGLSVAFVVIPQSLAYSQIAGMPLHIGLFASALPAIIFSFFASSPYLQTGPVAMTSLLTFGALSGAGYVAEEPAYVLAGALLALLVGLIRFVCGLSRFGWVAYLISDPVMIGFTSGAAIVIMASQFPKSVGSSDVVPGDGTIPDAMWTLQRPELWSTGAVALAVLTAAVMIGGRMMHRLFPGVLVAVGFGLAAKKWFGYDGPTVGQPSAGGPRVGIPEGLPTLSLDLPWNETPALLIGAFVIATVGFAEPSAIARVFANEDRKVWNPNRELFSSGLANMASGLSGAYPVGGSFSRSSVNRLAGARTRWSGGITGVIVLIFLGFASVLEDLPLAVLGGIVLAAVYRLVKPKLLVGIWRRSPVQAGLAWITFVTTIVATPNVHWAVAIGVGLSLAVHFAKPLHLETAESVSEDHRTQVTIKPVGLLWFATQDALKQKLVAISDVHDVDEFVVDVSSLVTVDIATMKAIGKLAAGAHPRPVRSIGAPEDVESKIIDEIARAVEKQSEIVATQR